MSLGGWGHTGGTVGAGHWGRRLEGGCGAGVLDPTYLPPGPLLRQEQQGVGERRTRTGVRGAQSGEGGRALGAGRGPPLKATSCSVLALPLRPPPRPGGLSPARSSGPGPGWARPQHRSVGAEGPAESCSVGGRRGDGTNPVCQKETQECPRGRVATEGVPRRLGAVRVMEEVWAGGAFPLSLGKGRLSGTTFPTQKWAFLPFQQQKKCFSLTVRVAKGFQNIFKT